MRGKTGQLVPVNAFARIERTGSNNAVNHQGQLPSVTLSFNLAAGRLSIIRYAEMAKIKTSLAMPESVFVGLWLQR